MEKNNICMKCMKKESTHIYRIWGRGYGSRLDGVDTKFQCCDECDDENYSKWFDEISPKVDCINVFTENYTYENNILGLVHSLPEEAQELFYDEFDKNQTY